MPEIGTSGSMSGDGKRGVAEWPKLPRPSSTLPFLRSKWTLSGFQPTSVHDQNGCGVYPEGRSLYRANAGLGALGRSMIWNSIPFMTTVDVLIIAVTVYTIWSSRLIGPSKRPSAPKIGLRWIAFGLLAVCLFYFADLASMFVLPAVTSMQEAVEFRGTLHRDL